MKPYPSVGGVDTASLYETLQYITRERDNDVRDWNNLPGIYMKGRKVGKIPASSADTDTTDRLGDFNYDASYMYLLVDNGGTAAWRRITLGSW